MESILTPEVIEAFKKSGYWPCALYAEPGDQCIYAVRQVIDETDNANGYELARFHHCPSGGFDNPKYYPAHWVSDDEWGGYISKGFMQLIVQFMVANGAGDCIKAL